MPEPLSYTLLAPRVNETFQIPGAFDLQLIAYSDEADSHSDLMAIVIPG